MGINIFFKLLKLSKKPPDIGCYFKLFVLKHLLDSGQAKDLRFNR